MYGRTGAAPAKGERDASLDALALRASQGDDGALQELCEKLANVVLHHAKYMLGSKMDAEDVSQNILIRVCENIRNLREPKAFRAWLAGIELNEARRFIADCSKRSGVVDIEDYLEVFPEGHDEWLPEADAVGKDERRSVMEILSHLPQRQREAVILRYFEDLNVSQVALTMRITHQCVSKYLTIAREKLKSEIAM